MRNAALPAVLTPEIIRALSLRQFGVLCAKFGLCAVWERMGGPGRETKALARKHQQELQSV